MQKSLIINSNEKLIPLEPITIQPKFIKLTIVPESLQKHIFHCFHTKPLEGHFSLYQTLHRIRLRFHWSGMYSFINKMITSCSACILKNNTAKPSSELLYSFPLDTPIATIYVGFWLQMSKYKHQGMREKYKNYHTQGKGFIKLLNHTQVDHTAFNQNTNPHHHQ